MQDSPDILENTLRKHPRLLEILLMDHSTTTKSKVHNILWATDSYKGHDPKNEIKINDITGINTELIQPRISKSKEEQKSRTKDKAEVFTPKEIVDQMNKQVDNECGHWPATEENWKEYIAENRLEITCGEAPFIVGRYNAANGKKILDLKNRVGFLDRKLQVVNEFCKDRESWLEWTIKAFKSSYGYEWQGDNLLLARENLLYTFIDYYNAKFEDTINLEEKLSDEQLELLQEIATIISWNIFQMDGIKFVIPMSCKNEKIQTNEDIPLLIELGYEEPEFEETRCPGCKNNDPKTHNGKPAWIMDWEAGKRIKFNSLIK